MTKPRISLIRLSDRFVVESLTLKNDRGRIFRHELDRAWDKAMYLSDTEEPHTVIVERVF